MKRIAIIGAGPAGLTVAYQLSKEAAENFQIVVFEGSDVMGGMSASISMWNQTVDFGPHRFFSYDRRVNDLWLEVVDGHYQPVQRLTRIYYQKRFFHYPLRAFNAFFNLGLFASVAAFFSYLWQRIFPVRDDSTFESWVTRRFGRRLYQMFFKTYSEKLWGISCKNLDADFASQRIKKLSLGSALMAAFLPSRRKGHKSLADEFLYPFGGSGFVYERMASMSEASGVQIRRKTKIHRVAVENNKVTGVVCSDGQFEPFDVVVSSMPLTDLILNLDNVPEIVRTAIAKLRYRNTVLVYLKVNNTHVFPDQWIYVHSDQLKTGRITNFRNWVPALFGDETASILALEFWCFDDDALWSSDDESTIALAKSELASSGLVRFDDVEEGKVIRLHRSYPVYFSGYRSSLQPVESFVQQIEGLYAIGRYGSYKYNNQDHSLLMGILAAENISGKACHDLWAVNTDYDQYQEN